MRDSLRKARDDTSSSDRINIREEEVFFIPSLFFQSRRDTGKKRKKQEKTADYLSSRIAELQKAANNGEKRKQWRNSGINPKLEVIVAITAAVKF